MDLAQLRQVVRNELSCNPSGLIATMGEKSKSTMTDIPAVMDELTLLNSVVNDLETKQIAHPEAGLWSNGFRTAASLQQVFLLRHDLHQ